MKYALIRNNVVENIVLWDGTTRWRPGKDYSAIDCDDTVQIGWTHDGEGFAPPPVIDVEDPA